MTHAQKFYFEPFVLIRLKDVQVRFFREVFVSLYSHLQPLHVPLEAAAITTKFALQ